MQDTDSQIESCKNFEFQTASLIFTLFHVHSCLSFMIVVHNTEEKYFPFFFSFLAKVGSFGNFKRLVLKFPTQCFQ